MEQKIKELEKVTAAWKKAIANNDQKGMHEYCNRAQELRKQLYPVILTVEDNKDWMGNATGGQYVQIKFADATTGWADMKIFYKLKNGKYTPNEEGLAVGITLSRGGGSNFLEAKVEKLDEVKRAIVSAGYIVM